MNPEKNSSSPSGIRSYFNKIINRYSSSEQDLLVQENSPKGKDRNEEERESENDGTKRSQIVFSHQIDGSAKRGNSFFHKKKGPTLSLDNLRTTKTFSPSHSTNSEGTIQISKLSGDSNVKRKWMIDPQHLKNLEPIGSGGSSKVYKAIYKRKVVAVKKYGQANIDHLPKELAILNQLNSPEIVKFFGAHHQDPYIVMEYCSRGSLFQVLKNSEDFDWKRLFQVATDVALGVAYLHSFTPPIIHRDLKSMNLLIDKNWKTKIGDFGLSTLGNPDEVTETQLLGTPLYLAPELLTCYQYSTRTDIYSLSIVFWEMMFKTIKGKYQTPYSDNPRINNDQIIYFVKEKNLRPTIPPSCPSEFREILHQTWSYDQDLRPSAQQLLASLDPLRTHCSQDPEYWNNACRFTSDSDVQSVNSLNFMTYSQSEDSFDHQFIHMSSSQSTPNQYVGEQPKPQISIHQLVKKGNISQLSKVLRQFPDLVNEQDSKGQTPLHIAAFDGQKQFVDLLLSCQYIDINIQDSDGFTPLHCACHYGQFEICELLLDREDCIVGLTKDGTSGLHYLSRKTGFPESKNWYLIVLSKLVSKGADVNGSNRIGDTPLHQACKYSNIDGVKFLLSKNANINAVNDIGETPLHIAVLKRDITIVKELVKSSEQIPDWKIATIDGQTVIDIAQGDILKFLNNEKKKKRKIKALN